MKFNKKDASILLWSIFLIGFISFSFLYISNYISKLIGKEDELNLLKYEFLSNSGDLIDEKTGEKYTYFPDNFYTGVLRYEESIVYTGITGDVSLNILNGSLYYSGTSHTGITSTGFNNLSNDGELKLVNMSGITNYTISSSNPFSSVKKEYQITKDIGGKIIVKTIGEK